MIKLTVYDAQRVPHVLEAKDDASVLDQLEAAGLSAPSQCRSGYCGTCACKVADGGVALDHEAFGPRVTEPGKGRFLTCIGGFKKRFLEDAETHEIVISL